MPAAPVQKLASAFSYFISRYAPAIITLLLLMAGFYFYFNVVVSDNEVDLRQRNFRGLHRMAANLTGKIDDYTQRNVPNFLQGLDSSNKTLRQADYDLTDTLLPVGKEAPEKFSVMFFNGWNFVFNGPNKAAAFASVKNFSALLLRRDLFPFYMLAAEDTIVYDELNLSHQSLKAFLPADVAKDTTKRKQLQSGESREVNIGGQAYKLFLLPFVAAGNKKFTIGGYMPLETYVSEQRYIPLYAILWMIIGLMVVILMFPLLKVFLMHRSEQLLVSNAISSLASLHVIAAIAVLVVLNSYVYFNLVLSAANNHLKQLAQSTSQNFTTELDASLTEIDSIKSLVTNKALLRDAVIALPNLRDAIPPQQNKSLNQGYQPGTVYPYFKHIAFTDGAGRQRVRWTTGDHVPRKIDISERDYFKAVKAGNLWVRNGHQYYLAGVSSWVANEKLAVIAAPFKSDTILPNGNTLDVISLSAPFRSVFNAIVPEGYNFCIVNTTGDVLFHLDENRSLNENLVEECSDKSSLPSLLKTRTAGFAASSYSGSSQRFYVQPITGTPYAVVTYRDMQTIWSENLDVISACSILCLMNLAVILLAILIIQAAGYKQSLLHSQSILFTWLRPNRLLKMEYRCVTILYACSMILQALFFIFFDAQDRLCLAGISFFYSYLLISYAYYQFTILNNKDVAKKAQNYRPFWFLAGFYLFSATVFTIRLNSGHLYFISAQLLLIGLGYLFTRKEFLNNVMLNAKNFRWWYTVSVFSFIAATAITPLITFYFLSFKEERILALKHNQLEFASRFMAQPKDTLAPMPDSIRYAYNTPYYFQNFNDRVTRMSIMPLADNTTGDGFERLYKKIKPSFSNHSREIEYLIKEEDSAGNDFHWLYAPGAREVRLLYEIPKSQGYFNGLGLSVNSQLKTESESTSEAFQKDWISFLLMTGCLVLLLWGFYFLLDRLIQKIFFEGYDMSSHNSESDLPFISSIQAEENIFVVGPVNSGKSGMVKRYYQDQKIKVLEVDTFELFTDTPENILQKLADAGKDAKPDETVVLLRHFEMFMNDINITGKKLVLFEKLLHMDKKITVLSSRSFSAMKIKEVQTEPPLTIDYTDRWANVMTRFCTLHHRWDVTTNNSLLPTREMAQKEMLAAGRDVIETVYRANLETQLTVAEALGALAANTVSGGSSEADSHTPNKAVLLFFEKQLQDFFDRLDVECRHSDFLWDLRSTIFAYILANKKDFLTFDFQYLRTKHMQQQLAKHFAMLDEKVYLKIQSLAGNYYLALWQSMTPDEQRTLYDIAVDDMVNPGNRHIAARLVALGLATRMKDIACFEVMNISFRNFIFSQLNKRDVSNMHAEAGEKGSFNNIQLPVIIVVVALGIFLFITQQDSFTHMLTYLGGATGGILALLKLLGMIPANKT